MISHLKLRLLASALTVGIVLHGNAGHAAPPATKSVASSVAVQLPHISIVSVGKGSPVVLIPGLACPRDVWDAFVPDLAKRHRVILVQVNGFGGDAPGENLKPGVLDGVVADLHDYLVRNKLTGAAVVGHSMGGLAAMMLARAHPSDLSRLLIVDSLPYFAVLMAPPGVDPTPVMVAPQAAIMRDRVQANYGKPLSPEAAEAQTRGLALKPESIARMKLWAAGADARVTGQAMYEDLTTDLRPDLAQIRVPTTVLYPWNATSPTKPMADAFYRKQYAALGGVKFVDIGDAAHMVMLDQPAAFQAALDAFLAS